LTAAQVRRRTRAKGELAAVQEQAFAGVAGATAGSDPPGRRRPARQLASYVGRRAFAVIGSCRPDGRPHAAMSSYLRQGREFWLPAVAGSVREHNARARPWLTMTITEADRDSRMVVLVEGPAAVVAPAGVPAEVRAAVTDDWAAAWIRLTAGRLLSCAAQGAVR
jgi:hypothetical protein